MDKPSHSPLMLEIVAKTRFDDDDAYDEDYGYARIALDVAGAERILREHERLAALAAARVEAGDATPGPYWGLLSLEISDYTPGIFSNAALDEASPVADWSYWPHWLHIADSDFQPVDICRLVVDQLDFHWRFYPKYAGGLASTARMPLALLRDFVAAARADMTMADFEAMVKIAQGDRERVRHSLEAISHA